MWIKRSTYMDVCNELAVLRERTSALSNTIAELRVILNGLTEAIVAERARSDIATDRLLEQQGVPPITPVKSPSIEELSSMFEEDKDEAEKIATAFAERGVDVLFEGTE